MTDLVKRLRRMSDMATTGNDLGDIARAADEIELLRKIVAHRNGRLSDLEYFWTGTEEDLWGPPHEREKARECVQLNK